MVWRRSTAGTPGEREQQRQYRESSWLEEQRRSWAAEALVVRPWL
jgi:hypothetical protein